MDADRQGTTDVGAIRHIASRWTEAVAAADLDTLGTLMCDDVVVIHGNGRMLTGREAVLADFAASFRNLRVEQQVDAEETVVDRVWAFERARVRTTVVQPEGGEARVFHSRTLTVLRREPVRGWCVARAIGVVETPARDG